MFSDLLNAIKGILESNTLIQAVQDYESLKTDDDPVAIIIPSGNESDYNTTEENVRIYAYKIMIFVKRTGIRNESSAERVLRNIVDSVIDDLDKDYMLVTAGAPVVTGYTFMGIFAVPSSWGYALEGDQYRVAQIDVTARVSVDLNNI